MNKFIGKILAFGLMIGSVVLTSCLKEESDNGKREGYGYVTVTGNELLGYSGTLDAGGYVKFVNNSITAKLKDVERAFMMMEYNVNDYSKKEDGTFTIKNATITGATVIPVDKPMFTKEAQEQKVMSPDSCSSILKINSLWAYKGYLTLDAVTYWGMVNGKSVSPKVSFVVLNNETTPDNTLNIQFCFNNNVNNNSNSLPTGNTLRSLDLSSLRGVASGNDSVNVNVSFKGIKNSVQIKMGRGDFEKPTDPLLY